MVDNDSSSSVQLYVLLTKISFPRKNYSHFPADSIFVLRGKVSNWMERNKLVYRYFRSIENKISIFVHTFAPLTNIFTLISVRLENRNIF